jgi:Transposase DDE domain
VRPRAIDSTTVQGPATKGTQWRVHYSLELVDLNCDWLELTDAHGAELLERTPLRRGDVLLADRNYLRPVGLHAAVEAGAYVLLRLRWSHAPMVDRCQRRFHAWQQAKQLRVGQVGVWSVMLPVPAGQAVSGRVVAMRLPAPRAAKAQRRVTKCARRKGKQLDPRTLQAAQLVMIFTTLPATLLDASGVLELYRYRWQLELACKRLKQLLKLGHLPHQRPDIARTWILAKLVVALLLETLYRNARVFSPWGYRLEAFTAAWP